MIKKLLSRIIVLVLACVMTVGIMASTAFGGELTAANDSAIFAEDENNYGEETYTYMTTSNGVFPVSEETVAVVESLEDGNYAENELLVIYEDETTAEVAAEVLPEVETDVESAEVIADGSTVKVTLDEDASMEEQIIEMSAEEGVEYVQPNYLYELCDYIYEAEDNGAGYEADTESVAGIESVSTNDPYLSDQLYLDQINISGAWAKVLASNYSTVRVAILDTGARVTHQDLTGSIIKSLCVDVTGDTYTVQTSDDNGHGTQVSSMIGATANNGVGMCGAATCGLTGTNSPLEYFCVDVFTLIWNGSEYVLSAYSDDVAKGINYAVTNGAKVINMSLGYHQSGTWTDTYIKNAIDDAYDAGVICVCAGGNEAKDKDDYLTPNYPSDYEKVIAVAALDTITRTGGYYSGFVTAKSPGNYIRADFSCYSAAKDICAPGCNDFGAYMYSDTSYYKYMSGTSQATPIVTSIVALMFMVNPNLTFDQVYSIITSTATDMVYTKTSYYPNSSGSLVAFTENATVGFDIYTGYGLINAEACIDATPKWSFDSETGVLTIFDDSVMTDYAVGTDVPWSAYLSQITSVVIQDGVTKIGARAFDGCSNMASVTIPATVTSIGNNAFNGCTSLIRVNYGSTSTARASITIGTGNTALTTATWKYTPCEHNSKTHVAAVVPTCTTDGNIEYWQCNLCDKYFSDEACTTEITKTQTVIHNSEHHAAQAATCTENGNTEYWYCTACQKYFSNEACTTEITEAQTVIAAIGYHTLEHHAKWAATFDKEGNQEYWYCTKCKKYFTDKDGNNETTWAALVIPKITKPDVTAVFDDVPGDAWYADNVAFVYARNIMTGMGGTKHFAPANLLQRQELAKMLYYLEDPLPVVEYEPVFPDVPDGEWYTTPIMWAYKNNIITGYGSGYFGVGDNITREQLAVMLYRYAKNYKKIAVSATGDLSKFTDAASVSSWAEDAIKWAVGNKIITGKENGTKIDPQGNTTRCECAAMFQRFMEKYGL